MKKVRIGKDDTLLGVIAIGLIALGLSGFFAKTKCPACKNTLQNKPPTCPHCRTPLKWN